MTWILEESLILSFLSWKKPIINWLIDQYLIWVFKQKENLLPNNLIFDISANDFFKEKKRYKYTNRKLSQITLLGIEGWVMGDLSA